MSTVEQALAQVRMVADVMDDLECRLHEAEELLLQLESSIRDLKEADEGNIGFKEITDWEDL